MDDANVNDPGHGHVEAWYARAPGRHTWTVAPAFAPIDGLELGAAFSRPHHAAEHRSRAGQMAHHPGAGRRLQCGAVLGASHTRGTGRTPYLNGLMTCNSDWGASHFNLGLTGAPGPAPWPPGAWRMSVNSARSRPMSRPSASGGPNLPSRSGAHEIAKGLQLDGTVGRGNRETLVSVGIRLRSRRRPCRASVLSNSALVITLTLLSAIAAPATTGLR